MNHSGSTVGDSSGRVSELECHVGTGGKVDIPSVRARSQRVGDELDGRGCGLTSWDDGKGEGRVGATSPLNQGRLTLNKSR